MNLLNLSVKFYNKRLILLLFVLIVLGGILVYLLYSKTPSEVGTVYIREVHSNSSPPPIYHPEDLVSVEQQEVIDIFYGKVKEFNKEFLLLSPAWVDPKVNKLFPDRVKVFLAEETEYTELFLFADSPNFKRKQIKKDNFMNSLNKGDVLEISTNEDTKGKEEITAVRIERVNLR